jgi:nitroreductase
MEFFEAVKRRRSVRKYKTTSVPEEVIQRALDAALLAPNSSNMQTWRIYWVRDSQKKEKVVEACLNQSAAQTAQSLLVFACDASLWQVAQQAIIKNAGPNPPQRLLEYYNKLIPFLYSKRFLAPIKWLLFNIRGIFKPTPRRPWSSRDIDEVAIKSCALACENFMLAIAAQGFDTFPMEGFDESRVKRTLGLSGRSRVVMVISVGERDEAGIWGAQYRLPQNEVISII